MPVDASRRASSLPNSSRSRWSTRATEGWPPNFDPSDQKAVARLKAGQREAHLVLDHETQRAIAPFFRLHPIGAITAIRLQNHSDVDVLVSACLYGGSPYYRPGWHEETVE